MSRTQYALTVWWLRGRQQDHLELAPRVVDTLDRLNADYITVAPRSGKVPSAVKVWSDYLSQYTPHKGVSVSFAVSRQGVGCRGRVCLAPEEFANGASTFELEFSLGERFERSIFACTREIARFLAAAVESLGASYGRVEALGKPDELSKRDYETFQAIDSMLVPTRFEWINAFHASWIRSFGWSESLLVQAPLNLLESAGQCRLLCLGDEPFSYARTEHVLARLEAERCLGLAELHARYLRQKQEL